MNAFNFATMTAYSGQNAALVGNGDIPAFATFQQLKNLGYSVAKGAKGVKIFCGYREKKEGDKVARVPKYAIVFDIIDTNAKDDKAFLQHLATEAKKLFK
jgi:hypothetical protein